jgi:ElaA protein
VERVAARLTGKINSARFNELTASQLYEILRLRSEVFVVEQECAYLDLDGRDIEPTTTHWWIEDERGRVVATARLLRMKPGSKIGRVVVASERRRSGLGAKIVEQALRVAPRPTYADAQSHLEEWYGRFGFVRDGDEFVEDGIPHVPMVLT